MRRFLALIVLGLLVTPAAAQTGDVDVGWFARGTFGDPNLDWDGAEPFDRWNDLSHELDFIGGNHWTVTVPNLLPNTRYQFKIGDRDYNPSMPNGDGAVWSDDNGDDTGDIVFHMYDQTTWSDGWMPNDRRRVGYDDSGFHDWEVMGSFNGFTTGLGLTDMGSGLHSGLFPLNTGGANPAIYDFKIRRQGNWDTSLASSNGDFSNSGDNSQISVPAGGANVLFELDLPNGRWRAVVQAPPQSGDHDGNGFVDYRDYVVWRASDGGNPTGYTDWAANYGNGTEPGWLAHSLQAGDQPLIHQGGTLYTASYTGLTPGNDYEFQAIRTDLSVTVPGSGVKVRADANGEIHLNFNELVPLGWEDGYGPNHEHRLGYVDPEQFGWEIVGTMNDPTDWPAENDPTWALVAQGEGVYSNTFTFATPGEYFFKFRHITADQETDPAWNISIGNNFGNGAGNIGFTVTDPGEEWLFELDLPNGRWKVVEVVEVVEGAGNAVPEPASVILVMCGALAMSACNGRKRRG